LCGNLDIDLLRDVRIELHSGARIDLSTAAIKSSSGGGGLQDDGCADQGGVLRLSATDRGPLSAARHGPVVA